MTLPTCIRNSHYDKWIKIKILGSETSSKLCNYYLRERTVPSPQFDRRTCDIPKWLAFAILSMDAALHFVAELMTYEAERTHTCLGGYLRCAQGTCDSSASKALLALAKMRGTFVSRKGNAVHNKSEEPRCEIHSIERRGSHNRNHSGQERRKYRCCVATIIVL